MSRVATNYAVTRELKRAVAKNKMKAEGKQKICKHSTYFVTNQYGLKSLVKEPSYFSLHWREITEE